VYRGCRKPATKRELAEFLSAHDLQLQDEQAFNQSIQGLLDKRLLLQINERYLALAAWKPIREIAVGATGFHAQTQP
jgi:hypothetical protein